MKILRFILAAFAGLAAVSCIENDLSYPYVVGEITSFQVEDQKSVEIDAEKRSIDIVLEEYADISKVKVLECLVTNDAEIVGGLPEFLDLRDSVSITLHVYEDFVWTVRAVQPIERYIKCDNQVGDAVIDSEKKTAFVYVLPDQSLKTVNITAMKLEPEGSVVTKTMGNIFEDYVTVKETKDCVFPMVLDCVLLRYFYVDYKDEEIIWSVKVLHKQVDVDMISAQGWTYSAGVSGETDGKGTPSFEYKKLTDTNWLNWADVAVKGTVVSAEIRGLEPDTEYVVRLSNGEVSSKQIYFKTGKAEQLYNLSFDEWSAKKGKPYPNASTGLLVWDSANGSGLLETTKPVDDAVSGKAARLESLYSFSMFAAGNIFTGQFLKATLSGGVGAELDWGTPFSQRPLALKGYYKYSPKTVDKADAGHQNVMGTTDQCQILICLADWDEPFTVNTAKGHFVDFEKDPGIIAFAQFNTSEPSSEYVEFTLPLVYRSNTRIPKYVIVAAASSRYGDYFTGAVGSVLHVDEFKLIYDPAELTREEYDEVFSIVRPA